MIKNLKFLIFLTIISNDAFSQDSLNNVTQDSTTTKPTLAIFDIRPANVDVRIVQNAVAAAFKKYSDNVKINEQFAPNPLPIVPPRMSFTQISSAVGMINIPECPQASSNIHSVDRSAAKHGELSIMQACIFQYKDGIRLNFFALFAQRSGGANVNVLGAMLGRAIAKTTGLGDSSKFIGEALNDIEQRLQQITQTVALVELQPAVPGKVVVSDPALVASSINAVDAAQQALAVPSPTAPIAQAAAVSAPHESELGAAQKRAAALIQQRQAEARTGGQNQAMSNQVSGAGAAIEARKELSAMGLSYFNQDQFVDVIRRNDRIAFELFVKARAVSISAPDKNGVTPLQAAQSPEMRLLVQSF